MATFGQRLKTLRKEKKLTQKQLAELFKISESGVSMFENDSREPSLELIDNMATYFDVSVDYLMGRSIARTSSEGFFYSDGGNDWTDEEKAAAAAFIEQMRKMKDAQNKDN